MKYLGEHIETDILLNNQCLSETSLTIANDETNNDNISQFE